MTTFVFRSGETGAPSAAALNTAGAIVGILDACLINGYNTQTGVAVSRSGTTLTFTKTSHGYGTAGASNQQNNGCVVTVSGFVNAEFNVSGVAQNVTANSWQFLGVAGSTASDSGGTAIRAPMKYSGTGWTTAFTGTNKRAYRQPASVSNGFYLNVDDSRVRAANQCDFLGFETMSALATGTGQFPTATQAAALSATVTTLFTFPASANKWTLWGNGRVFGLVLVSTTAGSNPSCFLFGDIKSLRSGDQYATLLIADQANSQSVANSVGVVATNVTFTAAAGNYITRAFHQGGSAINCSKYSLGLPPSTIAATGFPNRADGGVYMQPFIVGESYDTVVLRGTIPGLWTWLHSFSNTTIGDIIAGAGALANRTFECVNANSPLALFMETTDTWDV